MRLIKDLLYTEDNLNLEISKVCCLVANLGYWAVVTYGIYKSGASPDLTNLGLGWASVAGGSAAWLTARTIQERKNGDTG